VEGKKAEKGRDWDGEQEGEDVMGGEG